MDPGYSRNSALRFGRACIIRGICGTILMILPYIQLTLSY